MDIKEVFSYRNVLASAMACAKGVRWKGTVQNYMLHLPSNLSKLMEDRDGMSFDTGDFFRFVRIDRGKERHIRSVRVCERVIQRCLCDYCLVPLITPKLIYDNAACIKGRGMHFALRRLKRFLHRYWQRHGSDGYILQYDFHHYFDTIPHDKLIDMVGNVVKDESLMALYSQLVTDFGGGKGLGLGSQISQVSALYYPHSIDDWFVNRKGVEGYGRYMDDGYIIAKDKETLRECLGELGKMASDLGLELNSKKTMIKRIDRTFEFLKCRICLYPNGRIVTKPNRRNVTKNREKLRKFRKMCDEGKMSEEYVYGIFKTVMGNMAHFDCFHVGKAYYGLFCELFPEWGKRYADEMKKKRTYFPLAAGRSS